MRLMTYRGWTIFSRNSRTEWPLAHFTRGSRKDAVEAFMDSFHNRKTAEDIFARRTADGSLRVGRVTVQADQGAKT